MKALGKLFAVCLLLGVGGVGGYILHDRVPGFEIRGKACGESCETDDSAGTVLLEHTPSAAKRAAELEKRLERLEHAVFAGEAADPARTTVDLTEDASTVPAAKLEPATKLKSDEEL